MNWFKRGGLLALAAIIIGLIASPQKALASTDRQKAIEARGVLTVGLSADYAPLEFHATIDGSDRIVGADVALAEQIAKDMGVKLQIKEMSFDGLIGALKTGKIDMVISGMSETPERAKQVNFSEPYMYEKQVVVVQAKDAGKYKELSDFSGARVGAQKQTTQEAVAKKQLPGANVTSLTKANDVAAQVIAGKLDAGVLSSIIAGAYTTKNKSLKVVDPHFITEKSPTLVALPKGETELTAQVNSTIRKVKKKGLWQKYLDEAYELQAKNDSFWAKYGNMFFRGAGYTLLYALLTVIAGTVLGTLIALMRQAKFWGVRGIAWLYVEFIRGTPLMVQAFIVYFGTQVLGLDLSAFVAGAIAMGINSGAYVAEIIRSGLNSVPKGQSEAARSLGLSSAQTTRYVVLPQAIKNIWPALGNEFVTVIKESSVLSVIGATELMYEGTTVQGASFQPFLPMVIVALFYFVMTFVISRALGLIERRFA